MTEENPYEPPEEYQTPVEVELSYGDWLSIVALTSDGITWREEKNFEIERDNEARRNFMMALERPPEVESPLDNPAIKKGLRKAMAGRIPAIQEEVDDDTVYCEPCDRELDYTPSVLQVHNLRRHPEYD